LAIKLHRTEKREKSSFTVPNNGSRLTYYLWCHGTIGRILTTVWLGGLTGLLKPRLERSDLPTPPVKNVAALPTKSGESHIASITGLAINDLCLLLSD
jgi:hypothetical protein